MYNIAILDDEQKIIDLLIGYLTRFSEESGETFKITSYTDPLIFLGEFTRQKFDMIFLDIEMPTRNGMDTAKRIRESDDDVVIVFVTNMAQYAIQGYVVQAYRFLVKPVSYNDFSTLIAQISTKLGKNRNENAVMITSAGAIQKIFVKEIIFVEIFGHKATYHLTDRDINCWSTMKSIKADLEKYDFALCNSCYLVNLSYVTSINDFELTLLNGRKLSVSHSKKKEIMQKMAAYLGR